jgi:AcrR family transcriptional regulator
VTETSGRLSSRGDRHLAVRRDNIESAWRLARERGLAGWALRDLASAVGMRAPSLYVYFDNKFALYDAMFADGYAALHARVRQLEETHQGAAPVDLVRAGATMFVDFCVEDPARLQLLFLRTLPGFEPTAASYALAQQPLAAMVEVLADAGMDRPEHVDLWTALLTGLATQQVSNDPGGDRWRRLVDPAVDMFLAAHLPTSPQRRSG